MDFFGDGALAGLVETVLRPDHLWIENVAVAPEQQGRGFRRLSAGSRGALRHYAGRQAIRLMTNQAFVASVELYARRGYIVNRAEPFRRGMTVYMSKRIEPRTPAQAR